MSTNTQLLTEVETLCRRLRLPYVRKAAPDVLATARSQRWDPAEALRVLLEEEAAGRDASMRQTRRRRAGFPTGKTFDDWNPDASTIPAATQQALRTLEWVERRENLAVVGPSGTGKSHLLEALGNIAIDQNLTVVWHTLETLGGIISRHRIDDTIGKAIGKVLRADLIVIDDIGLLPVTTDAAEGFLRVVDGAYEHRSIAISSNLHPGGFDQLFPDTIANAAVDRLLHHAHLVITEGDSYRFAQARDGKGVMPLT